MNNSKTKQQIQTEQQFLYTLAQIVETFPRYTIAQHLVHFLRRKGDLKEPYNWPDTLMLSKVEDYYDELKSELLATIDGEDYYE